MCYVAVILIALSFISTELSVIWIRSYFEKSTCNEEELRCKTKPMYKTNFSTVSSLRRGNGQVGSMQNIVVAYFWL